MYFSYIHSNLNYANIAWASTYFTKLEKINLQQKQAVRFVFNEDRLYSLFQNKIKSKLLRIEYETKYF